MARKEPSAPVVSETRKRLRKSATMNKYDHDPFLSDLVKPQSSVGFDRKPGAPAVLPIRAAFRLPTPPIATWIAVVRCKNRGFSGCRN